jgi:hypothetical protein
MKPLVLRLCAAGASFALAQLAAAQTLLFDSGIAGLCINNSTGAQTYLGWTSGNAGAGLEQRWTPQPFTLPAGNWTITQIQAQYFLVAGQTPVSIDWKIWSRNGQNVPVQADEIASGSEPYTGTASLPLYTNVNLSGGDYYVTIYGVGAGAGGAGGYVGWYTNAQGGQGISFTDVNGLFMWRSAQYPTPGFTRYSTAAFSPDPGTDGTKFYCAEFRIYGEVAPVNYCTPGTSQGGCLATMSSSGAPSVAASSGFTLTASNVPGQRNGLIFYGVSGGQAAPWGLGTSFLCVKSPTQRMTAQLSGGTAGVCDGSLSQDWLAYVAGNPGALGSPFSAGNVIDSQGWYRDPGASKNTNLSDGLEFTLWP